MQQFSRGAESGTVILLGYPRLRVTVLTYSELNGLGQIQGMWSADSQNRLLRSSLKLAEWPYNQKFAGEKGQNPRPAVKVVRATMAQKIPIDQIVEKAVSQVLEGHLPELRKELVRRVLEEVQPHLGGRLARWQSAGSGAADLLHAVSAIHAGTTQKEILRALLESTAGYSGRAALFVIKAGSATGWQGRAFDNNEDSRIFRWM